MKKNNRKNKLKAIVAVVLVITSMFTMSSLVNASIVEWILGDEYAEVVMVSSSEASHKHQFYANGIDRGQPMCAHGFKTVYDCTCDEQRIGCIICNPNLLK